MNQNESDKEKRISRIGRIIDILLSGNHVPQEDLDEIRRWLADDDLAGEKTEVFAQKFSEALEFEKNPRYTADMWPKIAARIGFDMDAIGQNATTAPSVTRKIMIPLRRRVAFRVAAVLIPAAILIGGVFWWTNRDASPYGRLITVTVPATDSVRKDVVLADGSMVHVMPGSEITYGERHVELRGEARFNVTKAKTPQDNFTVHTDRMKIAVLGTEFRVDSREGNGYSTVDLYHGSVEAEVAGRRVPMNPGEHLHYDHAASEVAVSHIDLRERTYDDMPGLVFDETDISDVLAIIEHDYGVRFVIEGEIPEEPTIVNGDFTAFRSLDEVMSVIRKISGSFSYEILDDEIKIKLK